MNIDMKMKNCPQCFKILSVQTRFRILNQLKKAKKANVKEINSLFKLSQPTVSHHLKVLKKLGVLKSEKIGKEVFYFLNKKYSCPKCQIFKLPYFK